MHSARAYERCHRKDLLVLAMHHLQDHVTGVTEPGRGGIESHNLAETPGGALERCTPIAADCLLQPLVLVSARRAVAAGRTADPGVARVEAPLGPVAENTPFEEDTGRLSGKKPQSEVSTITTDHNTAGSTPACSGAVIKPSFRSGRAALTNIMGPPLATLRKWLTSISARLAVKRYGKRRGQTKNEIILRMAGRHLPI
jgi:hypothetical protein